MRCESSARRISGSVPRAFSRHLCSQAPDLATVGTHQSIHGRPIIPYKLRATDSDGRCEKLKFSATGLPAGLEVTNLNNCTATVSGTFLAKPGRYVVTYQVTDERGASDSSVAIFVVKRGHQ